MNFLLTPLQLVFSFLTVAVFASWVRRLLGLRFSWLRTLIAGLIAFSVTIPITSTIGEGSFTVDSGPFPGIWFLLLGVLCGLVLGMVFLVVAEAVIPTGSLPGPLFVMRSMRRRSNRGRRYVQISRIIVKRGLGPYLRGARRAELATAEGRSRLARRITLALEESGVTFVKLGQVLSTRSDLVSTEFVEELSRLQDDAGPLPWEQIEEVLRAEWGADLDTVFAHIERQPLASASIAQVHGARLVTGEEVVIKVRRPGAPAVAEQDLDIIAQLARTAEQRTQWGRAFGAVNLAEGFGAALREELDLRIEAANTRAVAATVPAEVVVPTLYPHLCSEQVLVMSRMVGVPLGVAAAEVDRLGLDPAALAGTLLDCMLRQVLVDGVFHADPHPGNILLLADGKLGLLDFGSVGRLDATTRSALQRLLWAMDRGDSLGFTDSLLELVDAPEWVNERTLERAAADFMMRHLGVGGGADARMFGDLFAIITEHGLSIPPGLAAVFRALGTLEGTVNRLAPGFDVMGRARAFGGTYFAEQLTPHAMRRMAWEQLVALTPILTRLPRRLDRIAAAMEGGQFGVKVRLLADERERGYLGEFLNLILTTFLAAATGIMSVMLIGMESGPRLTEEVGLYPFMGYCLLVVSAVLGLRVLATIFRPTRR